MISRTRHNYFVDITVKYKRYPKLVCMHPVEGRVKKEEDRNVGTYLTA